MTYKNVNIIVIANEISMLHILSFRLVRNHSLLLPKGGIGEFISKISPNPSFSKRGTEDRHFSKRGNSQSCLKNL